jgi:hypothetical protein
MMEAVRTSETSGNFSVTTRRYIPEDSKLHTLTLFVDFNLDFELQKVFELLTATKFRPRRVLRLIPYSHF